MEEYSETDNDVEELEDKCGLFRFLVVNIYLKILRLTLEIFSLHLVLYFDYP